MERRCRRTLAPPFAFGSGASSATKKLNIFRESSSQTTWTFTAKAAALGTGAFAAFVRDDFQVVARRWRRLADSGRNASCATQLTWLRRDVRSTPARIKP